MEGPGDGPRGFDLLKAIFPDRPPGGVISLSAEEVVVDELFQSATIGSEGLARLAGFSLCQWVLDS